ncbi:hypothetical protein AMTR_s00028p00220890 [Amborella trichopoda]|uniref:Uncharacterized protein n=1 Tax=Amborella trichopoda TaxID=13333 RepID=W1PKZ6_AMBTC|nr:hypothetical protein AMTR_s00028p00220890 [Amborella trichopoda]
MAAVEMILSLIIVEMNDGKEWASGWKRKAEMEVAGSRGWEKGVAASNCGHRKKEKGWVRTVGRGRQPAVER